MRSLMFVSSLAMLAATPSAGLAEDCEAPCIDYSGSFDTTFWWIGPGGNATPNSILIDSTAELEATARLLPRLSIAIAALADPLRDSEPGKNRIFEDAGAHLDNLRLQYDGDDFSLWAGKIHPVFGRAHDVAPGLYGAEAGAGYELSQRIGAGGSYSFAAGGFSNIFAASAFTLDRTALSGSLFSHRGRTTLADGGAGNTAGISSVALSLAGCKGADFDSCYDDGELGYQLSARYQRGGEGSAGDEIGLAAGINRQIPLTGESTLKFFAEAAWFWNYDGASNDAMFAAASAALVQGNVTASLTLAAQDVLAAHGGHTQAYVADAALLYDLGGSIALAGESWSIGLGYTFVQENGFHTHYIGLKAETTFEGSLLFRD